MSSKTSKNVESSHYIKTMNSIQQRFKNLFKSSPTKSKTSKNNKIPYMDKSVEPLEHVKSSEYHQNANDIKSRRIKSANRLITIESRLKSIQRKVTERRNANKSRNRQNNERVTLIKKTQEKIKGKK